MYFIISGEGSSDVGCDTENPGPLMNALKVLAGEVSDQEFRYEIISRTKLAEKNHSMKRFRKFMYMRGQKNPSPNQAEFAICAETLAQLAMEYGEDAGVVLFRDCDFPASVKDTDHYYKEQVKSIERGFSRAQFKNGVPMVPKTRSECWLLCCYQENPYSDCARFERLSGSDKSPNSAKKKLAEFFGCSESHIYEYVSGEDVKWDRIDCPSFLFFKKRFQHVVQRLSHLSTTFSEIETIMSNE